MMSSPVTKLYDVKIQSKPINNNLKITVVKVYNRNSSGTNILKSRKEMFFLQYKKQKSFEV